jgi:putative DNA primase/helicase
LFLDTGKDTTEGFFSRWVVIPFTAFFPAGKADPNLIGTLTSPANLQGLLRASVGGLQSVMRRGGFTMPASVVKATDRFRREADPMQGFIEERVQHDAEAFIARTDLYTAYTAWAGVNGFHSMSAGRFYEAFTAAALTAELRPRITALDGVRGYRNISIR